jgi:8-oxo-dGTP pyrophosphatase MutT (NUDIX family)
MSRAMRKQALYNTKKSFNDSIAKAMMTFAEREQLTPSATVVLVRPSGGRFEVYLIRRSRSSGFMGGLFVFPGGVVDPVDCDSRFWLRHVDLPADRIDRRLGGGLSTGQALSYGVAAIRETLEESGVMLARQNGNEKATTERIAQVRARQGADGRWFAERIAEAGWTLTLSSLNRWSRWITPLGMSRRFDTRFFAAAMPEWQRCSPDDRETVDGRWATPLQGLEENLNGGIPLSPPTVVTLHQLLDYDSFEDVLEEAGGRSWGETIRPRMVKLEKGAVIIEPWDPQYGDERIDPDANEMKRRLVRAGEPFSRIWFHEGRWRPVAAG